MLPAWVNLYVGIPYLAGGGDRLGLDCYGLARLVLGEVFGKQIPAIDPAQLERAGKASVLASEALRAQWAQSPDPTPGNVVAFRVGCFSAHVGVCIGGPMFIHVLEGSATCVESLDSPAWRDRIAGIYRWQGEHA